MHLFEVYPLNNITPLKALGSNIWDINNEKYLDLYGGHAVISVGHSHPHYIKSIEDQLHNIGFYSNSVQIPQQKDVATLLGTLSGYDDYQLFFVNSGAEANENALKVASFHTGRKKVLAFNNAFHGRTSGSVAATDNPKIVAPFNSNHEITFVPLNDLEAFRETLDDTFAAVIIEGIQGVGGIQIVDNYFLQELSHICKINGIVLILDEVQSGYGRTGKFFAHQYANIQPDIITMAKGMGNGFPVGGVLIQPEIKAWSGMLGTTFGGNYLACAASKAVLEIIRDENLIENAVEKGIHIMNMLHQFPQLKNIRGRGLMIGFDIEDEYNDLKDVLLNTYKIFLGNAGKNTIRILPALNIQDSEILELEKALKSYFN